MYSNYYGFSHKPFELTPNPDVIFLSETHQEALSVLLYGVYNRKGFLQISGDVGAGKSTLVQALIRKLENNVHLCHIPNPNFTVQEFYYYISVKFGLDEFDGNKAKFIINLSSFLEKCRENDEFALLIIDEAQVLSLELLEEIRLLSNQEYTEFGVLSIFFVGQPELNSLLQHKKMAPLRNRIGIRFNLEPLTLDETISYIQYRLRKAGRTVLLFSQHAFQKIHAASGGIPRSINILCDNALLAGFAEQRGVIDKNIITDCIKELELSDIDIASSEDGKIDSKLEPDSISPKSVFEKNGKVEKEIIRHTPGKKLAFVFVILCVLFFAMIYTTEYWGRFPGTKSAKNWFEKLQIDKSTLEQFKELFTAPKSDAKLNSAEKNMIPEKIIASSGRQDEKSIAQKKPAVITKPIAEPAKKSNTKDSANAVIIETGRKPGETRNVSIRSQVGAGPTEASLIKNDTAVETIDIRRNPDGTNSVIIGSQVRSEPAEASSPPNNAIAEKIKPGIKPDETNYVSITSQVGGANIRSGPSMNNNILRSVSAGYPLRVIDRQGDWSLVEDYKKRKGWIAGKLIIENITVILMFDKGNLRKGPSYHDDIVANIDYGTVLQVVEKQKSWLKLYTRDGILGWIHEDMVWP